MASKGKQRAVLNDTEEEYPTFKDVRTVWLLEYSSIDRPETRTLAMNGQATILKILQSGFKKDDGAMQSGLSNRAKV